MTGPNCFKCGGRCSRHGDNLQCVHCRGFYHIHCAGVSVEEYLKIRDRPVGKEYVGWSCKKCQSNGSAASPLPVSSLLAPPDFGDLPKKSRVDDVATGSTASRRVSRSSVSEAELIDDQQLDLANQLSEIKKFMRTISHRLESQSTEILLLREEIRQLRAENKCLLEKCNKAPHTPGTQPLVGHVSYAKMVGSGNHAVLVKPSNPQKSSDTKAELYKNIDPVAEKVSIASVKHVTGGGLIVKCASEESASKFQSLASSKLGDKYNVKEVPALQPRIRIAGITEKLEKQYLVTLIRSQNVEIFQADSVLEVISVTPVKASKSNMFQALLQVDQFSYRKAISSGRLYVGYDSCSVYDGLEVLRCYNCCAYGHVAKNCKGKIVCPRCAGDHPVKDCKSVSLKCSNCVAASRVSPDISVDHAVWDHTCTVYGKKLQFFREETLGLRD